MFEEFDEDKTVVVTTFRRDGTPVDTPVHIAVDHGTAFIRTYASAGKWKRLRSNPALTLSHANMGRRPALLGLLVPKRARKIGPGVPARVVALGGQEADRASRALAAKYPFLQGFLIPLLHRLVYRSRTVNMKLKPG
jgi:PPOX class probable F420-dependent enzyme